MRVMYVTPGLGGGGGAERSLASMAPFWRDLELEVVTFTSRDALVGALVEAGAGITRLPSGSYPQVVRSLRRTIKELQPDLIHSVLFDADILARLAAPPGLPTSSSWVGMNYGRSQWSAPGRKRWKFATAQLLDAGTAIRTNRFHAVSNELADVMSRRLGVSRSKVEVIPRGRSRAEVGYRSEDRKHAVRDRLGLDDQPLLVTAARHEWAKGLDVLIRAVPSIRREVPNLHVAVAGPFGEQSSYLRKLAAVHDLDPDIVFLGQRNDVPDLLSAADVVCVPSRSEGCCNVMIEAMALGSPLVAAGIPALHELDPARRWARFFAPEDSDDLAYHILAALTEVDDKRSDNAVQQFDRTFRSELVAARMVKFFQRAAGSSHGHHHA